MHVQEDHWIQWMYVHVQFTVLHLCPALHFRLWDMCTRVVHGVQHG